MVKRDGEPWFVAFDVATLLGYAKPRNAISEHCKGARKQGVLTAGGNQQVTVIPERDVYRLVFRSHLPAAQEFEDWVVGTVLPSIRKNGGYIAGQEKVATGEMTPAELMARALLTANATIADVERARRLAEELFGDRTGPMPIVLLKDGLVIAISQDVAAFFEKRHDHVLRDIDVLSTHSRNLGDEADQWFTANFAEWRTAHPTVAGRVDRSFNMTQDGFAM